MAAILIALLLTLPRYAQTAWLATDGSARVEIEVDLPAGTSGLVRVPAGPNALTDVRVTGILGAHASVTEAGASYDVMIELPRTLTAPATVSITGRASSFFPAFQAKPKAFGNRTLTYRFVNSTPTAYGTLSNAVILPDGFVVTSVEDSEPSASDSSTTTPFAVISREGRHGVVIADKDVGLGDATSVTVRFKQRRISPAVPVALAVLSAFYLLRFRDLTRPPPAPG